jgi:Leucine-rich repeat (LRR) protein
MNRLLFFFLFMLFFSTAKGQRNYQQAIDSGYYYYNKGIYQTAIKKYFAAEAFDPTKKDVVNDSVNSVYLKIEALKNEALQNFNAAKISENKAKKEEFKADRALERVKDQQIILNNNLAEANRLTSMAQAAERRLIESLNKAERLINAFYFYDGKYALAYNNGYYFIDKNGNSVEKLGKWMKAEQFDSYGFAKVIGFEGSDYLKDTTGAKYKAAYSLSGLNTSIMAVDLSNKLDGNLPYNSLLTAKNLQILYCKSNHLESLPEDIGSLTILTTIDLSNNKIAKLPKGIWELNKLAGLYLSYNKLGSLPIEIGKLTKLTRLYLGNNNLNILPKEIWNLENLSALDLSGNNLESLPKEIGKLTKLTRLFLGGNKFIGLPNEIWGLTNLTDLYLDDTKLAALPIDIGKLTKLTRLFLSKNQLTSLPKEIGKLENLKGLYLSNNLLEKLPSEIGQLRNNLTYLDLSRNKLSGLPKDIGELKKLTGLYLSNNQLTNLPEEIRELKNLTYLDIRNNSIPASEIEKIRQLLPFCEIKSEQ